MSRFWKRFCIWFFVIAAPSIGHGQGFFYKIFHPDGVGLDFTMTHQWNIGNVTAGGPGIEFFVRYNLNPNFFVTAGTGIYTITDEMLRDVNFMATLLPLIDLKVGYQFMPKSKFSPHIDLGFTAFGAKPPITDPDNISSTMKGTFYDAGILVSAGADFIISNSWSFFASIDYRYLVTSPEIDGSRLQHTAVKLGVMYAMSPRETKPREVVEYPLGDSELVLDDLFREDLSTPESGGTDEDALAMLFQPESSATGEASEAQPTRTAVTYPPTEAGMLMQKIDELKGIMEERNDQMETLAEQVRSNERAIAELSRQGVMDFEASSGTFGVQSTEAYTRQYETGLRSFYNKQYSEAIGVFQSLLETDPDHRLASNCQYWIGECHFALRDFRRAMNAFHSVMNFRRSYKFDDALLMSGLCYLRMGDPIMARENFQLLVSRFPESEYAPKAMRYLGQL